MRTRKSLILLLMAAVLLIGLGSAHASSPEPNWADSYTLPVFFRSYTSGHYSINVDFGSFLWDDEMLAENNASDLSALQSFTDYTFEWVGYDELQNVVGNSLYLNANPGNLPRFDGGTRDAAIEDLVGKVVATLNVTKGTEPVTSVNIKLADIMDAPTVNQDGAVTQYVHFTPGESVTLTIANPPTIAEGATMKYLWTYQNPTTHQTEYVETDVPSLTLENLTAEYDNVAVFWYAANVDYVGGLAYDQWYKVSEYGQSSYTLYDKTLGRVQMPFYNRINENIKLYPNDSYTMKVPASTSGNPDKKMVYRWDVLDPDTLTTTYQYTTEPELTITNTYPAGTDMGCGVAVGYEGDSEFDFLIYDCYFNFSMKDKPNLKEYYTFPIYLEKYITESGNDYCTLSINTYNEVLGGSWTLPVDEKIAQELNDNFFTLDITKFTYRWELAPAAQEVFGENFEGRTIVSNKSNLPICTSEAVYTADLEDKLIRKPFISLVITDGSTPITTFDFIVEDFIDCVDVDNEKSPRYKYVKFVPGETITLTVSDKVYDPNNDLVYNWSIEKFDTRDTLQSGKGKTVTFTPTEEYDMALLNWNVRSAQAEELFGTRGGDFSTPVLPGYTLQSVNSLDVQVPETDRSYYEVTLYEGESFTFKMPEAKPADGCEDKKLVYKWHHIRDGMFITTDKPELTVTNDGSFVGDYQYFLNAGYEGEHESLRVYPTYFGVEMKDGVNVLKIEEKTVSQVEETLSSAILQQHGAAIETPAQMKNLMLTVLENAVTTELSDTEDGSIGNQLVNIDVNIIDLNTGADRPATAEDYAAEGGIYTMIPWVNGVPRYVENCEYIVTHLFETDSLNHKAGDIEVLTPLKVDERGLHVMLTGASTMMITWVMPDATLTPPVANDPIPTPPPPAVDQVVLPDMEPSLMNLQLYKNESYTLEMPAATGAEGKELVYRWHRTVLVGDDMGNNMVETSVPSLTITNDVEKASKYQYNLQAGYKGEEDSFRSYPSYYVVEMLDEIKYVDVKDPEPLTKVETELMNSILDQHGVTIATPAQLQELMLTVLENDQLVDLTATTDNSVGSTLVDVEVVIVDAVTGAERPATPEDFAELGKVTVIIPWPNGVPQNAGDYEYFITHMFETDGNGHKAGEIEILIPFRVDARGLYVTLTGASPMLVTWVKSNAQLTPIDPTVPTQPSAPPATGDSSPISLWVMLMALSAIVVAMQLRKRKA